MLLPDADERRSAGVFGRECDSAGGWLSTVTTQHRTLAPSKTPFGNSLPSPAPPLVLSNRKKARDWPKVLRHETKSNHSLYSLSRRPAEKREMSPSSDETIGTVGMQRPKPGSWRPVCCCFFKFGIIYSIATYIYFNGTSRDTVQTAVVLKYSWKHLLWTWYGEYFKPHP